MPPTEADLHDARAILEWVLGVSLERSRLQGPVAGGDFSLSEEGRRTGGLVVVRSVRSSSTQSWGTVRRSSWDAAGRRSWVIRLDAGRRSSSDEFVVPRLLVEFEQAGGTEFRRADQVRVAALRAAGVRLTPAERVLEDLAMFGVVGAESEVGSGVPPRVVAKTPVTAFTSSDAINNAVEDEAWRPANRARLADARLATGDRHLFVWLDPADLVATSAMEADEVPAPPLLAPETTTLWVARRPYATDGGLADRVWQTSAEGEWEALGAMANRRVLAPVSPA